MIPRELWPRPFLRRCTFRWPSQFLAQFDAARAEEEGVMLDLDPAAVAARAVLREGVMLRDLVGASWATVAWDGPLASFPGYSASDEHPRMLRSARRRIIV